MPRTKDIHGITQRHRAYDALREALVLRRIPAGQRLRELEWTQQIGVNRTALREALARLCAEGLVVEGDKSGYLAPSYTREELSEIMEVRQMVEAAAVARIIRAGCNRSEYLRRVRKLCDELEWIVDRGYSIEIAEPDHLFHEALVHLSANRRLMLVHRCLPQTISSDPKADTLHRAAQARWVLQDHRAIVDAIQKSQLEKATSLLHRHYGCRQGEEKKGLTLAALAQ
jgi:DNA-binding GntR family transcriptional regulator